MNGKGTEKEMYFFSCFLKMKDGMDLETVIQTKPERENKCHLLTIYVESRKWYR